MTHTALVAPPRGHVAWCAQDEFAARLQPCGWCWKGGWVLQKQQGSEVEEVTTVGCVSAGRASTLAPGAALCCVLQVPIIPLDV
jgi:hypothetical protein